MITKLDLGNCYWFDPSLLVKLIARLSSSLTSLHIQGTKLCSSQIAEILSKCPQIVELSVSFSKKDNTFWLPLGSNYISGDFVQDTVKSSVFHRLESNLNRLTSLSLHGSENCFRQFLVFLWYLIIINTYFQNKIKVFNFIFIKFRFCNKSLESINLEFFHMPQDEYVEYEDFTKNLFQLSPQLPFSNSIRRVTSSKANSTGCGYTTSTILVNLVLKGSLDNRQPADGADYEDDYYPTQSERVMDVIWFPQNDAIALYRYLKDEGTGLLMTDEHWSDEDLFSKFTGITSLCLLGTPESYTLGNVFLKEAENKLTNLKLLCSPYDPQVITIQETRVSLKLMITFIDYYLLAL